MASTAATGPWTWWWARSAKSCELPNPDTRYNVIHAYFPSIGPGPDGPTRNIGAVISPTFLYWEGDAIFL
ncbi:MAG: hypothetical protein R2854_20660 [Caldilineaceae bacterium]